jgi:hypothetical protein
MIDSYLKFEKNTSGKSKTRFDLSKYSEPVYDPLNKEFIYLVSTPEKIRANQKRKSDIGITQKDWISAIYIPDITKPNFAYADIKDSEDLILFNISSNCLEMFVCKGKKNLYQSVMNLYCDGELDEEIKNFRSS